MAVDNFIDQTKDPASVSLSEFETTAHPVISVDQISKIYPLYARPSDRLKQSLWYALPNFLRDKDREFYQEFWALQDVSFEVNRGETIGIIGRNGSGKSTLLQIIAGTLTPTHGEVQVSGGVAALLELGSGFNLEFTGRENVYLNGSILGLSQAEIDALYDEIVAFADIGPFIDQPVKLYSSGMVVRLAFAVQAFVPKQVLIVDEALAVGDEAFQRKCMGVLERFRDSGGTVLLVSHDMQTIVRQCDRCLLLHQGILLADGESKPVTDLYQKLMYSDPQKTAQIINALHQHGLRYALGYFPVDDEEFTGLIKQKDIKPQDSKSQTESDEPVDWFDPNIPQTKEVTYGNGAAEIFEYGMYNPQGQLVNVLIAGNRYEWGYKVRFYQDARHVNFGMMLKTVDGLDVAGISSNREGCTFDHIKAGSILTVTFALKLNLVPGTYFLNTGVDGHVNGQHSYLHRRVDICMIRVLPCDQREPYGLAYLEPKFSYTYLSNDQ